jgi:hypothetical protein
VPRARRDRPIGRSPGEAAFNGMLTRKSTAE